MRQLLLLLSAFPLLVFFARPLSAQIIFQDNFDSYVSDSIIDPQSTDWTGWDNVTTSGFVSDDTSASANNSLKIWNATVPGSSVALSDVTYHLGDKTSGRYLVTFKVYVPSQVNGIGAGTYWNMLHVYNNSAIGAEWAFQVYLRPPGQVSDVEIGGTTFTIPTKYDQWVKVAHIIDLNRDLVDLYYDGQLIMTQRFSQQPFNTSGTLKLAAVDFFAECGGGGCVEVGYFDDFLYKNFPDQYNDAGLVNLTVPDYCTGFPVDISADIKNFGFDTINSVTVNWSVDGVLQTPVVYNTAPIFPNFTANVNLGSYLFTGSSHQVKAWTSSPNNNSDSTNFNDTLEIMVSKPTISGPSSVCPNIDFTLSVSGSGTGVSYNWQYLDTNTSTWVSANAFSQQFPVIGGINAPRSYRAIVTCVNGGSDTSSVIAISLNSILNCYCVPEYSSGCSVIAAGVNSLTVTGANGTSINDLNTSCSPNSYGDRTALPPVDMIAGVSYNGTINSTYTALYVYAKFWIDFDEDGIFQDTANLVGFVGPFDEVAVPFRIKVPSLTNGGLYRMRVRTVYNTPNFDFDPCTSESYGEVHDYMVNVISPNCKVPDSLLAYNVGPTTADFSWLELGVNTEWVVEYDTAGFVPGTGIDSLTSSNPLSITGLTPNTEYEFYVRSVCGRNDTSFWGGPFKFRTLCVPYTAPYSNNFENEEIGFVPSCWESYISIINPWVEVESLTGASAPYAGTQALYLYSANAIAGNDTVMAISPEFTDLIAGDKQLRFHANSDNPASQLIVGTTPSPTSKILNPVDTINFASSYTYQEVFVEMTTANGYNGTDTYVYFQHGLGATYTYIRIDDFHYEQIPSCKKPRYAYVTNLSSDSADIGWTEMNLATQWMVEYGLAGFNPGSGTTFISNSNPASLNSLSPSTAYEFYVRAVCGRSDTSSWTGPFYFETPCVPTTSPYYRTFENDISGLAPTCWTAVSTPYYANVYVNSLTGVSAPFMGSKALYLYGYNGFPGVDKVLAVTPGFSDLPAYDKQIRFFANSSNPATDLIIGTMASPVDNTPSPLDTISFAQPDSYEEIIFLLDAASGYNGTDEYIYLAHSLGGLYSYVRIDEFHYEVIPTCKKPKMLNATNITTNSALLSWQEINVATEWLIEYGPNGFVHGSGIVDTVNSNPYTLTGLSPYTSYDYYVRSACGRGDSSFWSGPYTFVTAAILPFAENFENFGTISDIQNVKGWQNISSSVLHWQSGSYTPLIGTGPDMDHTVGNGGIFAFLYSISGSSGDTAVLASPFITVDTAYSQFELKFWYHKFGSSMGNLDVYIESNGVEDQIKTIIGQTQTSGVDPWISFDTLLTGYAGESIRVLFKGVKGVSIYGDMAIDDVSLIPKSELDGGLIEMIEPTVSNCYTNNEPITISLMNAGLDTLDFATINANVTMNVTGAVSNTLTYPINNNSLNGGLPLAPFDTIIIPIDTMDLSIPGHYYFEFDLSIPGDSIAINNIIRDTIESAVGGNVLGPDSICSGSTVSLVLKNYAGSIQWQSDAGGNFANINGANFSSVLVNPTSPTSYRAVLCGVSYSDTLSIEPISLAQPIAFDSLSLITCGDTAVVALVSTSSNPNAEFEWYTAPSGGTALTVGGNIVSISANGDSLFFMGSSIDPNLPSVDTFYVQEVIYTSTGKCISRRDTAIATIDCIVGFDEVVTAFGHISIYPNPSQGIFNISGRKVKEDVQISIYQVNGKLVYRSVDKLSGNFDERVNISGFAKGLYFVKIQSETSTEIKKIVIQ